jgi:large subunit ribosomal protein L22
MGRAYRYQRRISHIEIAVAEKSAVAAAETNGDEPKAVPAKKVAAKKAPAKKAAAKKTAAKKTAKK